jgi:hypothetical protein
MHQVWFQVFEQPKDQNMPQGLLFHLVAMKKS